MTKKIDKEMLKASMRAPCGAKDENGKLTYPCVDCNWDCDNCAWNPREKARRLREGRVVNGTLLIKRRGIVNCSTESS